MNLSKQITMVILEHLIQDLEYYDSFGNEFERESLQLEAEIKCFQNHLKTFVS